MRPPRRRASALELVARRARRSRRVAACVGADLEQQKAGRGAVRELEAAARARRRCRCQRLRPIKAPAACAKVRRPGGGAPVRQQGRRCPGAASWARAAPGDSTLSFLLDRYLITSRLGRNDNDALTSPPSASSQIVTLEPQFFQSAWNFRGHKSPRSRRLVPLEPGAAIQPVSRAAGPVRFFFGPILDAEGYPASLTGLYSQHG